MKKVLSLLLMIFLCLPPVGAQAAEKPITVYINGQQLYMDTEPVIRDSRVYVPVRAIAEALDTHVDYQSFPGKPGVKLTRDYTAFEFRIGWGTYGMYGMYTDKDSLDSSDVYIIYRDEKSFIYKNRTYVPLRLCAEALAVNVAWNGDTRSVTITGEPGRILPPADAIHIGYMTVGPSSVGDRYYKLVYGA